MRQHHDLLPPFFVNQVLDDTADMLSVILQRSRG
jgi:hypothetical protein